MGPSWARLGAYALNYALQPGRWGVPGRGKGRGKPLPRGSGERGNFDQPTSKRLSTGLKALGWRTRTPAPPISAGGHDCVVTRHQLLRVSIFEACHCVLFLALAVQNGPNMASKSVAPGSFFILGAARIPGTPSPHTHPHPPRAFRSPLGDLRGSSGNTISEPLNSQPSNLRTAHCRVFRFTESFRIS